MPKDNYTPHLEDLEGDPEPRPEKKRSARPKAQSQRTSYPDPKARPEDVSERVWDLADKWLEAGAGVYGSPLRINRQEFARRLRDKVKNDRRCFEILLLGRAEYLFDAISRMATVFWLEMDRRAIKPTIQFAFLEDDWDDLLYRAETWLEIQRLKKVGGPRPYNPRHRAPGDPESLAQRLAEVTHQAWVKRVAEQPLDETTTRPRPEPGRLRKPSS